MIEDSGTAGGTDNGLLGDEFDSQGGYAESRLSRRLDELEYREERVSTWLRRGIFLLLSLFLVMAGLFIYRYIQVKNEPPRTYNDLQLRIWRDAVNSDPKNPTSHANLGYVYFRTGSSDQAMFELNEAVRLDSKHTTAHYYRGLLYKKRGKTSAALKDFAVAAKYATEGNRFLPEYEAGQIYEKQGKYKEALEAYKRGAADKPIIWNSHFALARMYEKTGEKDLAVEEYKTAGKFNPQNEEIQAALKRLGQQ